ncbi:hypothetical protein TrLO_g15426 [Triparma laevis f. longispina]|uniref:Enolase-phosphatase E1 n=1 Tax=Triparma laevis f. longispina TaxID=1714387 RepID=A0A9W7AFA3_9STRA|nr:hypothetical protein TrLO_g15426 [Triparma laevis f. longispina]
MTDRVTRAVLLDIEGTCCPLSFVKETLYPHCLANLRSFFSAPHLPNNRFTHPQHFVTASACAAALEQQYKLDIRTSDSEHRSSPQVNASLYSTTVTLPQFLGQAYAAVNYHTQHNRKVPALKNLQSVIWNISYENATLQSPIYSDIPRALAQWTGLGIKIYIYSSGSRPAQHDFFKYSNVGDLRPFISGYFDTKVGPKNDSESYRNIALSLGVDAPVFITDVLAEAKAASEAGFECVISLRDGNEAIEEQHDLECSSDFSTLSIGFEK